MSIKSLAVLVLLLVSGVLASVRAYLQVDRKLPLRAPTTACECCESAGESPCNTPYCFDTPPCAPTLREGRRLFYRSGLAVRRGEVLPQSLRDS